MPGEGWGEDLSSLYIIFNEKGYKILASNGYSVCSIEKKEGFVYFDKDKCIYLRLSRNFISFFIDFCKGLPCNFNSIIIGVYKELLYFLLDNGIIIFTVGFTLSEEKSDVCSDLLLIIEKAGKGKEKFSVDLVAKDIDLLSKAVARQEIIDTRNLNKICLRFNYKEGEEYISVHSIKNENIGFWEDRISISKIKINDESFNDSFTSYLSYFSKIINLFRDIEEINKVSILVYDDLMFFFDNNKICVLSRLVKD